MSEVENLKEFTDLVENELLPCLNLKSIDNSDPVVADSIPHPWHMIGAGNYAAVFSHPDYSQFVAKVYAEGRPGIEEETEVYRRLGSHPAYSECFHYGRNYLILKYLKGITLYDALRKGVRIPEKVIIDIDSALAYAKTRDLHPHDVHFKNIMMKNGRGFVVDVSDFCHKDHCPLWNLSKKIYYRIYLPFLYEFHPPIPGFLLDLIRKCYQLYKETLG